MYLFDMPDPESVTSVADWVELYALANKTNVSKSDIRTQIEFSIGNDCCDELIDDIWGELNRRNLLYGRNPPFLISSKHIQYNLNWDQRPEHLVCIILSLFGNERDSLRNGKLFQKISNEAIRNYFGAESLIYGSEDKRKLKKVASMMHEKFCEEPPRNAKDRGVDIIAWKPFGDRRPSQIIGLFQCAAGKNWREKTLQISKDVWRNYIAWRHEPFRGFCLVEIIDEEEFHERSAEGGVVLDRTRIFRSIPDNFDQSLRREARRWCRRYLSQYRN